MKKYLLMAGACLSFIVGSGQTTVSRDTLGKQTLSGGIALNKLGMTTIYLKDGTIYKDCTIRAIHPLYIEYIKNKTLHDFHIERIKCIVPSSEDFVIWFNEEKKPVVSTDCGKY